MTEVVTYIRCQINGKWTNLGIIAEEDEIKEHFEFVEGLLKEKQHADRAEKKCLQLEALITQTKYLIDDDVTHSD